MTNSEIHYPVNAKSYLSKLKLLLENTNTDEIDNAVNVIIQAWKSGRQIITLGNGGSSMTAIHMITDWSKMIYLSSGIPFRGRTLVDNMGLIMAYGNDISFNDIFIEQLKNIMLPGDLVIAISGSGNSENVIRAVNYANENGAITLGLSGFNGGKLKQIAQHSVWANVNDMQLSEDIHAIFGHIVMQRICH
jgi:D-sedoheptulose 7-phosphate isomerase